MSGSWASILTHYYGLGTADSYSERLSRFPRATTREAMCSGCNNIRPDWGLRPVEVHLWEAPCEPGPIPGILQCVMLIMTQRLWAEIGPLFGTAVVGPVVWGPDRTAATGWVSVHTPRSERIFVRCAGERTKYDQCAVCGAWRVERYGGESYLVEDELADRSLVHNGGRVYVSPEVRKRLAGIGFPGLDFGRVRVCMGPKAPLGE